ncbi:hypothetical protein [Methyloglobulus sp.]|uniref:hypothetical protein n=1 Tax=Methyloglobulus sp. TaxID=2518622 RepID=UPI003989716D
MKTKTIRMICLIVLVGTLTGCAYWWRAYQTYLQMGEFDKYFSVVAADDFTLQFKEPIMLSEDFVSLARLRPTEEKPAPEGKHWRYWFRKVDGYKKVVSPEVKFHSDLDFNKKDKLVSWSFSSLFLDIAPPKFLEASLRSLGGAEINKDKMQLRGNTDAIEKISADLPKKPTIVARLGQPFEVKKEKEQVIYIYRFLLDTKAIDKGYEDRALSEVKLSFDNKTQELVRMAGRFAGLKISINYKKFQDKSADES